MSARSRVALIWVVGFALAGIMQFGESQLPFASNVLWPGAIASFGVMLPFHASFWDHPRVFDAFQLFFNGLLYTLTLWILAAALRSARR